MCKLNNSEKLILSMRGRGEGAQHRETQVHTFCISMYLSTVVELKELKERKKSETSNHGFLKKITYLVPKLW